LVTTLLLIAIGKNNWHKSYAESARLRVYARLSEYSVNKNKIVFYNLNIASDSLK